MTYLSKASFVVNLRANSCRRREVTLVVLLMTVISMALFFVSLNVYATLKLVISTHTHIDQSSNCERSKRLRKSQVAKPQVLSQVRSQ